jgi:flagellar L-ring protein precursor FlgH
MTATSLRSIAMVSALLCVSVAPANAEDLYNGSSWAHVASDRKASEVGDALTVIIDQSAEARNAARNDASKRRTFAARVAAGSVSESADLVIDGGYAGQGAVSRSESLNTQITAVVTGVLPNGDLRIAGHQRLHVNGERTNVQIRGRVRPHDITANNTVPSTRIADAEIDYDGRGFVSRNAKPGPIHAIFGLLGLGG